MSIERAGGIASRRDFISDAKQPDGYSYGTDFAEVRREPFGWGSCRYIRDRWDWAANCATPQTNEADYEPDADDDNNDGRAEQAASECLVASRSSIGGAVRWCGAI